MFGSVRGAAAVNQNCLQLLDVSATRAAADHWLMHHCQWALAHSTVIETFKVIPEICDFLDQLFTTLSRLKTVEAVSHAFPRVWEVLSRLASNVSLLVHKSACEKLLKCIDIFVSDTPELASEVRRKAHAWATRLLHGIAKILDQINDLSAWDTGSGQMHYDVADLIRDARIWVDSERSYLVCAEEVPRDLSHLLETCLLFLCLRKTSAIINHVLACVGKLPSMNAPEVATFLDQANRILSDSYGYDGDFWSTTRAAVWECHTTAFEAAVVDYAAGCATQQQCLSSANRQSEDRLQGHTLIETCARSFVLCYRATMMLRQITVEADGSQCAVIPLRLFHLFLKDYIYKLGGKASIDVGWLYAGYLSEATSVAATPVTAYRNVNVLKARLSVLADAILRSAAAAADPTSFREYSEEIHHLLSEQHDWYWASAILSASKAVTSTEVSDYLNVVVITHLSSTTQTMSSSEFMSDFLKQKAEICTVLANGEYSASIKADTHTSLETKEGTNSSLDLKRQPILRLASLDVILLLRHVLAGSSDELMHFLCKFSSSPALKLGVIFHVLQHVDLEYWKAIGVLTCAAVHCIRTVFERCVQAVGDSRLMDMNEQGSKALCLQAALDFQRRFAVRFLNAADEEAVPAETPSCSSVTSAVD